MSTTRTSSASPEEQRASSPGQHDSSIMSQSLSSVGDESSLLGGDMEKHPKGKRKRTAYVLTGVLFFFFPQRGAAIAAGD